MDARTAQRLSKLTSDFYAQVGESFSATRASAWPGWDRVLSTAGLDIPAGEGQAGLPALRILDLACGNLRFERYLAGRLSPRSIEAACVDSCDFLVDQRDLAGVSLSYFHCDLAEALQAGDDLGALCGRQRFDLAVCFGFLHHLPLREQRVAVLGALAQSVRSGGAVAVSFWQLGRSPALMTKAQRITAQRAPELGLVGLGEGDYLLGWQNRVDALRYCHDFSEEEIDALVLAAWPNAKTTVRFSADGRTGNLNRYVVAEV